MAKKILLADDSITIQKVITITFASEDYELVVVGDGDAAIRKAADLHPDLIMADVAMPGKNGYEVCSFIKNDPSLKQTPVLLLAGTFEPLNKDEAIKAGADDSIVKPFESQELLDKVRELLSRSGGPAEAPGTGRPAPAPSAPELQTNDMWEAGDFLTLPDEFDTPSDDKGLGADLDFISSGALFDSGEHKDLSLPHEGDDFTDLVIQEEDLKPSAGKPEAQKFEPLTTEHSFDTGGFEPFNEEPARSPFDLSAFELKEEAAPASWEAPAPEAKAAAEEKEFVEPDLLEIPEEVVEAAPQPVAAEEEKSFERTFEAPRPIREVISAETAASKAAHLSEEEVEQVVQRACSKVEERLVEDMNLKLSKAEAKVTEAVERVAARLEERLRAEMSQKLSGVDSQVAEAVEAAAARFEDRLTAELGAKLEKSLAVPKDQVEEIVAKTSRQVIEHVAWEVLPELAERLIKGEINRVKDAFMKDRP